ncbi:glutamate N-acetyltransferase/amino-acid N-acetyltransferase [Rhodovulum iodosum]|uniref:Arginine biosynthesis bifunctional protein ArgJ n=1 Tax=Rhodovulum iodosum TaxID=68291 RepID=A0ABV3XRS6_9RHOB|nr:bifunctional glutamate N-acetyltransferase/amino-acid acetyltransferase ArgJ [Rhodovulum robiginosum]RSK30362.1 bifunctional glutamate N-acetyltransferase/amino-acid acetyltransferase ArgJ [Rhodovulum robiginosum]
MAKKKSDAKSKASEEIKPLKRKVQKLRKKLKEARAQAPAPPPAPAQAKTVSPLAPEGGFGALPPVPGVDFAAAAAGVRYAGRPDVMMARLSPGTQVAGVFTRSSTRAAPVLDCEAKIGLEAGPDDGAAFLVNSGNSNAFTGKTGEDAVRAIATAVSDAAGVPEARVFTSSTGVIGEPLPHARITAVLDDLTARLAPDAAPDAAHAIMTTDTFAKGASASVEIEGETVQIIGFAKGSGMIAPDMATMLVYLFTDANIARATLQKLLTRLTDETFNCITVDGDTSTSDTILMAATCQSAAPEIGDMRSRAGRSFADALKGVMMDLAHQVVRDGEGATKFVEIAVTGAASPADARKVAMSVANSPLVKTALAGEDPNWGRIVMAVGKSGAKADRDLLSIRFGDILVAENGWVAPGYREGDGADYMKRSELVIGVDLGLGEAEARVWTCDLTHRYIEINADYRS